MSAKYYDTKDKVLFEIYKFEKDFQSSRLTGAQIGGNLTINTSSCNFKYLKNMLNDIHDQSSGLTKFKNDYVRDIIIIDDGDNLIKLHNCLIANLSFYDENMLNPRVEADFRFDYHEILGKDSEIYYELIMNNRSKKINDLLN